MATLCGPDIGALLSPWAEWMKHAQTAFHTSQYLFGPKNSMFDMSNMFGGGWPSYSTKSYTTPHTSVELLTDTIPMRNIMLSGWNEPDSKTLSISFGMHRLLNVFDVNHLWMLVAYLTARQTQICRLSPSAGSLRAAASFRLSTARRADRTDHLAARMSVVRPCRTVLQRTERVGSNLDWYKK